jgi:sterol desaturase/sphingolipid hydroxylase (fatty acid hydroxylase superfamily)
MTELIYYFSFIILLIFGIIIHYYEDTKSIEKFKRIDTLKFDLLVIAISSLFVLFILDLLLNKSFVDFIHRIFGLGYIIHSWPPWLCLFMALIIGDLGYYLVHRFLHLPLIWNAHRFHHSTVNIYWFSGLRSSFINSLIIRIPYLIGFQIFEVEHEKIAIAGILLLSINFWIHANLKLKYDNLLSYVFITPNFHRLHHVNDERVAGNNFGNILSIWDHIFGTAIISNDWSKSKKGEFVKWRDLPRQIIGF